MHTSVQIVSQQLMDRAMQNDKLERISFCGNDEVLGLQVKLNNAYGWKVTTLTEIPDRCATSGSRSTRKRAVAEESTVVNPSEPRRRIQCKHLHRRPGEARGEARSQIRRQARAILC